MKSHRLLAATVLALLLLALAMLGAIQVSAQQPGSISGTVYCDANHNYTVDPGEGVAGVTVSLWDNCNYPPDTLRSTQSTGSNGEYSFTDILPLDQCYAVSVEPTDPALGVCNFTSSPWYPVTVSANNPDLQNIDFPFIQIWEKWIDGQPWAVDFSVTAQTSDTIQVVDVISVPTYIEFFGELVLVESWNPAELDLIDVEWSADSFLITETGTMTWTLFIGEVTQQGTITKTFHVEPCTWTSTTLDEDLYRPPPEQVMSPEDLIAQEPVVVNKTPPDLWIDSTYSSEVSPGQLANFTLSYGNNGGYENSVMIRNDFPAEAPYDSADPAPDREAPDGSWVEWDVGDLSTGATGSIAVTVSIEAGLSPSTTMVITDAIYNHVEQVADSTEITFHIEQPPLSLGDLVWYDTDQNGIQDAGEPGVQGIDVDLYARDCAGQFMASDTTDANGNYLFQDLLPGIYCLQFSNIPAGWLISPQNQGADDALDSDADPTTAQITNINLQDDDLDEDMGIYAAGSVGDTVFCDANYNGLFDAGEGVAGVGVSLYDDPGCDGAAVNLLGSQDTTGDGQYLFASLMVGPPGGPAVCYVAEVDGTDPALGNCTNPITPLSYAVSLDADAPDDLDADFGFSELLSLGNLVWDDANANGIQDAGEPGVQGVVATLYPTADCSGGELVAIDTTDANGIYGFTGLNPGTFCIAFSNIPAGWLISPQNQGANPALDSDADPATGLITNIALTASDLDEDMGIYQPEAPKPVAPPVVPEASTLILLGGAVSGLAGYVGLQIRARRRKSE